MRASDTRMPSLIIGPSHAIRWKWHRRDEVVPGPLPSDRILGQGGAPIWSRRLFDESSALLADDEQLVIMVPDFRFGNGISLDTKASAGPLLQDGFLAITPTAMTIAHDRVMLERSIAALHIWHERFGSKARYVFWCLFGRQVHDRMAGKHIENRQYHHPAFNYYEVTTSLPELDIVDLAPLLSKPIHDIRRLFIDSSSHPSQVGYLLLNGILFDGLDALTAYERAVATTEGDLVRLAEKIRATVEKPILLTGRSVWLDVLMTTLGATGTAKLAESGLILAPLNRSPGQPPISEILRTHPLASCQPVVIAAGGQDLSTLLDENFGNAPGFWRSQPVIDWESATEAAIRRRGETPNFLHTTANLVVRPDAIRPDLPDHAVEQGPQGMPSWTGLIAILNLLSNLPRGTDWQIDGEVLITANKVAFLIGDNHSVLKFATGKMTPTRASLNAFRANISSRLAWAKKLEIPYLHVIFPDKQSVLSDQFPIRPLHRLGDVYMAEIDPVFSSHVLWPADRLKHERNSPFLPLDTHLTDHGSLAVLQMMLKSIGIDAGNSLKRIGDRIVRKQRWKGDLGNKLNPPLYQEGLLLDPDWSMQQFRSPGGFNDGMVDIILNPGASVNKTVLLFGDSFFRMMLNQLGAIFTQVICLRTRYLHPEMLTLIQPDIIFTGNSERYLSSVIPDTEASAFSLYPHLRRSEDLAMPEDFLAAWDAVTSPYAKKSRDFFSSTASS